MMPVSRSGKTDCAAPSHSVIGVGSGKGGVGKSTVSLNLALALAAPPGAARFHRRDRVPRHRATGSGAASRDITIMWGMPRHPSPELGLSHRLPLASPPTILHFVVYQEV
jgi:hypothetical protein